MAMALAFATCRIIGAGGPAENSHFFPLIVIVGIGADDSGARPGEPGRPGPGFSGDRQQSMHHRSPPMRPTFVLAFSLALAATALARPLATEQQPALPGTVALPPTLTVTADAHVNAAPDVATV